MNQRPAPSTSHDSTDGANAPHAMVYVPGIDRHWFNRRPALVAQQLAVALDRLRPGVQKFEAKLSEASVSYGVGDPFSTPVHTINRIDDRDPTPVVDLYILDYHPTLTGRWENTNILLKTVIVLLRTITGFAKLVPAFFRALPGRKTHGKGPSDMLQAAYLMGILLLLVLYLVLLVGALATAASDVVQRYVTDGSPAASQNDSEVPPSTRAPALEGPALPSAWGDLLSGDAGGIVTQVVEKVVGFLRGLWELLAWMIGWMWALLTWLGAHAVRLWQRGESLWNFVALLGAAILVFTRNSQQAIENAATTFVCAWNYLSEGVRRDAVSGQLTSLLQHLAERENPYDNIHVLSYSFGSIVALDALYPHDKRPAGGYEQIDTLVTVGCPFDLLRMYFPHHFANRTCRPGKPPKHWINIYCPHDVLGSNFRNDTKSGEDADADFGPSRNEVGDKGSVIRRPDDNQVFHAGIGPRRMSLASWLSLYGMRAHGLYWADEPDSYDALLLAIPADLRST